MFVFRLADGLVLLPKSALIGCADILAPTCPSESLPSNTGWGFRLCANGSLKIRPRLPLVRRVRPAGRN